MRLTGRYRSRSSMAAQQEAHEIQVYQVVRKILDDHAQYAAPDTRLSFALVYDEIRRSNSSLNRKNKKLLEDSIERVLETIQLDSESDSANGEMDSAQPGDSEKPASNGLNRSIVGMWSTPTPKGSSTPKHDTEAEPREKSIGDVGHHEAKKRKGTDAEPPAKKRKATTSTIDRSPPTHVSLADLGGVDDIIQQLQDLLVLPMTRPEIYSSSKIQPPRGVLIHGPPGCGKTMIANAFAAELGVNFISISAPSVVSGMSGESEKALREHFDEAKKAAPCLIFIDEIDAITPKRESAQREMEKRIVAQLLTCMDDLALEKTEGKPVIVLAATNRPDSLDPALRRGGRFDKEINMNVPSEAVRQQILIALTRRTALAEDVDFTLLAKRTPGFVGADLNDLVSTAGTAAIKRYLDVLIANSETTSMDVDQPVSSEDSRLTDRASLISPVVTSLRRLIAYTKSTSTNTITSTPTQSQTTEPPLLSLTQSDFLQALPQIQPSALREGFATIPSTTFSDIGALSTHRAELTSTIIQPISHPSLYQSLGVTSPAGLLLWGPPGCGKTLLAKAIANESRANFISVKGPELLNKYVGESERAVRQVFVRARSSVPVIVFFDELDALVPRRDSSAGSEASSRVVNTLLTELDGVNTGKRDQDRQGIYIIAATNRPDMIDPAMLRPGRLGTLLYIGLPDAEERVDILRKLIARKIPSSSSSSLSSSSSTSSIFTPELADLARSPACDGLTGADLEELLRRAGYAAIRRGGTHLDMSDFHAALHQVRRSVAPQEVRRYEELRKELSSRFA